MASNGPDPREFLEQASRMLRELFGDRDTPDEPWAAATRRPGPSSEQQRENLTFALATRAVEALEDLALNTAAIRQRLERLDARSPDVRPGAEQQDPDGGAAR
jgi:hypothetical protein